MITKRAAQRPGQRSAMTLIEIVLALALTVLVAGLIGGLTQWYVGHRTRSDQTFAQLRLARTLLSMIADDLRCVVRNEPLDVAPLKQLLAAAAAGSGAAGGGGSAPPGDSGSGSGSAGEGSSPSGAAGQADHRPAEVELGGLVDLVGQVELVGQVS